MTHFEYILGFASILLGLAVSDLAASLHRLLRARARVRFDWLPLATALLVLLTILQFWWAFYGTGRAASWAAYGAFLPLVALLIVMFLLASAALPDAVPEAGLDLGEFYWQNARYFWLLFGAFDLLAIVASVIAAGPAVTANAVMRAELGNLLFIALVLSLAFSTRRAYHATVVAALLAVLPLAWSGMRLG